MCPDPQVLSIYMDGELPSPWKEKLESHAEDCPKCKEKLEKYQYIHSQLTKDIDFEASMERVWEKLAGKQHYSPTRKPGINRNIRRGVWQKRLSVPLPIAAAAALLIVFGAVFLMQNRSAPMYNNQITEYPHLINEMPANFIPTAQDMNSVLQYLDDTGADIIILQLPESRNFSRAGEPEIIRAADYPAARSSRRQQTND